MAAPCGPHGSLLHASTTLSSISDMLLAHALALVTASSAFALSCFTRSAAFRPPRLKFMAPSWSFCDVNFVCLKLDAVATRRLVHAG